MILASRGASLDGACGTTPHASTTRRRTPPGAGIAGTLADEGGLTVPGRVHWGWIRGMLAHSYMQRGVRGPGRQMERFLGLGVALVAAVPVYFRDDRDMVLYYSW